MYKEVDRQKTRIRTDYGRWSEEKIAEATALYNSGISLRQIAIKLGGKPTTLRGYLVDAGTPIRPMSYYQSNDKNRHWKGDAASYTALHTYIRTHKPMSTVCERCSRSVPLDAANISGKYRRSLDDWEWLCRRCHMDKDGRLEKLINSAKAAKLPDKTCPVCGKVFHSNDRSQVYCSKSHAAKAMWAKQPPKTPNKVCPQCQTPFYHRKSRTIYCSRGCYTLSRLKLSTTN